MTNKLEKCPGVFYDGPRLRLADRMPVDVTVTPNGVICPHLISASGVCEVGRNVVSSNGLPAMEPICIKLRENSLLNASLKASLK